MAANLLRQRNLRASNPAVNPQIPGDARAFPAEKPKLAPAAPERVTPRTPIRTDTLIGRVPGSTSDEHVDAFPTRLCEELRDNGNGSWYSFRKIGRQVRDGRRPASDITRALRAARSNGMRIPGAVFQDRITNRGTLKEPQPAGMAERRAD
jgi:hypothetical protein